MVYCRIDEHYLDVWIIMRNFFAISSVILWGAIIPRGKQLWFSSSSMKILIEYVNGMK
jgi:hypothetical protein